MEKPCSADQCILLYVTPDQIHLTQTDAFYGQNKWSSRDWIAFKDRRDVYQFYIIFLDILFLIYYTFKYVQIQP